MTTFVIEAIGRGAASPATTSGSDRPTIPMPELPNGAGWGAASAPDGSAAATAAGAVSGSGRPSATAL